MEIAKGIEIIETALWLKKQNILIINDLHIGYEEVLQRKGILVPKFQLKEIITKLEHILEKTKPEKVIINGDLKHEFGTVLKQEWKEVLQFLDVVLQKCKTVIIIKGNHDPIIAPIAEKRRVAVVTKKRFQKSAEALLFIYYRIDIPDMRDKDGQYLKLLKSMNALGKQTSGHKKQKYSTHAKKMFQRESLPAHKYKASHENSINITSR